MSPNTTYDIRSAMAGHNNCEEYSYARAVTTLTNDQSIALFTVGPPGSGKSTWAEAQALALTSAASASHKIYRTGYTQASRDFTRDQLSWGDYSKGKWDWKRESEVTQEIEDLFERDARFITDSSPLVYMVDDTNLNARFRQPYIDKINDYGIKVFYYIADDFDPSECIDNITSRAIGGGRSVPMQVFARMAKEFWDPRDIAFSTLPGSTTIYDPEVHKKMIDIELAYSGSGFEDLKKFIDEELTFD